MVKKKVKKYVWLGIVAAASNILFPIIIIAAILLPFTFSYQILQELDAKFEEGLLKLKTETWDKFENALKGGDPGEEYEEYLINIYTKISEELDKDKELEEYIYDQSAIGIGWVYSRIYGATMKASWFESTGNKLFGSGGVTSDRQGYVLHDESTTISNIYDPYVDSELMDVADIVHTQTRGNDVITPYDLQAFDYVGGTLFEMLEMDVEGFKEEIKSDLKYEIEDEIKEQTKPIYADAIKDLTKQNYDLIEYVFLMDTSYTQFKSAKTYLAEAKKDYPFSIKADMSGIIKLLESNKYLSGPTVPLREKAYNSYKKIYDAGDTDSKRYENAEITKEDYANIVEFSKNIEAYLENYIKCQSNLDSKSKKEIIKEMKKIVSEAEFGVLFQKTHALKINSIESDTGKDILEKEAECTKTLTVEEFDARIKQKVKDLELGRTWKVAETYMKELIALEAQNSGFYYSFNNESLQPILDGIKNGEIEKIGDSYVLKDTKRFNNLSELISYLGITSAEFKTDATNSAIVAGVSKSGTNYLTNEVILLKDKIISSLKLLKNEIPEKIKSQLEEAKKNEEEMYKENMKKAASSLTTIVNTVDMMKIANSIPNIKSTLGIEQIYNDANNGKLTLNTITHYENIFKNKISNFIGIDSFSLEINQLSSFYATAKSIVSDESNAAKLESKYNELTQKLSEESQKTIQDLIDKYESLPTEGDYYTNTEYYKEADISTIYSSGKAKNIQSIGSSKNELKIYKYKNTVKEAVMNTAQKCYPEKIREFSGLSSGGGNNISVDANYFGIHTDLVGTQVGSDKYNAGIPYANLIDELGEKYGFSGNILYAMIAQETGFVANANADFPELAQGIAQIMPLHYGVKTVYPIDGSTETLVLNATTVLQPEIALEYAANLLRAELDNFEGNFLHAISAYNIGGGGHQNLLNYHMRMNGTSGMTWLEYVQSGDTAWLETRLTAPAEDPVTGYKILSSTVNALHLEHVVKYLDLSKDTYVKMRNGDTIWIAGSGKEESPNKLDPNSYFKNKELIKWEEYYTDYGIFKKADEWAEKEAGITNGYSQSIIDDIKNYSTNSLSSNNISSILKDTDLSKLIAKSYYIDYEFKDMFKVAGSKPSIGDTSNTNKSMAKFIGDKYVKIIKDIAKEDGIDLGFAVYLYCVDDDKYDVALNKVKSFNGSFNEFIKNEYLDNSESLTEADSLLTKIARIITGKRDAKISSYFDLTSNDSSIGEIGTVIDGRQRFYNEWLEAKNIFHELYNAQLDDEIEYQKTEKNASESKIAKLEATRLPIVDINWENGTNTNNPQSSDGLFAKLTLKENDTIKVNGISIIKKQLTNKDNFAEKGNSPEYIVIHQAKKTTAGARASQQYSMYNGNNKNDVHKSVHYSVDSREIYKFLNDSQQAYHIGENTLGISNSNSIAIEYVANSGEISEQLQWNLVALTKYLMEKHPTITTIKVMNHSEINNENCPDLMIANGNKIWNQFLTKLKKSGITIEFEEYSKYSGDAGAVIEEAMKHLEKPYVWGGKGPNYFDCSGFVQYVFETSIGMSVPAPTWTQMTMGIDVSINDIQPGDLIFFRDGDHVAIFIGEYEGVDSYIHAGGRSSGPDCTYDAQIRPQGPMYPDAKVMISPITHDTITSIRRVL